MIEKLNLPVAEELQAGLVEQACIKVGVRHMVKSTAARYRFVECVARGGLEHPVGDNGEADATHIQFGVVHSDSLLNRSRIEGIGHM